MSGRSGRYGHGNAGHILLRGRCQGGGRGYGRGAYPTPSGSGNGGGSYNQFPGHGSPGYGMHGGYPQGATTSSSSQQASTQASQALPAFQHPSLQSSGNMLQPPAPPNVFPQQYPTPPTTSGSITNGLGGLNIGISQISNIHRSGHTMYHMAPPLAPTAVPSMSAPLLGSGGVASTRMHLQS
jgi:hypothetical protein